MELTWYNQQGHDILIHDRDIHDFWYVEQDINYQPVIQLLKNDEYYLEIWDMDNDFLCYTGYFGDLDTAKEVAEDLIFVDYYDDLVFYDEVEYDEVD